MFWVPKILVLHQQLAATEIQRVDADVSVSGVCIVVVVVGGVVDAVVLLHIRPTFSSSAHVR